MTTWRWSPRWPRDGTGVVLATCVLAVIYQLVADAADQFDLGGAGTRFRILWAWQAADPLHGLLLVVAAGAAVLSGRDTRVVQVLGVVLVAVAIAGSGAYLSLNDADAPALGQRIGGSVTGAAGGIVAAFAVWLARQPAVSAGGSPPDAGTA